MFITEIQHQETTNPLFPPTRPPLSATCGLHSRLRPDALPETETYFLASFQSVKNRERCSTPRVSSTAESSLWPLHNVTLGPPLKIWDGLGVLSSGIKMGTEREPSQGCRCLGPIPAHRFGALPIRGKVHEQAYRSLFKIANCIFA